MTGFDHVTAPVARRILIDQEQATSALLSDAFAEAAQAQHTDEADEALLDDPVIAEAIEERREALIQMDLALSDDDLQEAFARLQAYWSV